MHDLDTLSQPPDCWITSVYHHVQLEMYLLHPVTLYMTFPMMHPD
jgi:hypothetical protein